MKLWSGDFPPLTGRSLQMVIAGRQAFTRVALSEKPSNLLQPDSEEIGVPFGLGHVVGILLGHGQFCGKAVVRIERAHQGTSAEWAVEFVKPDRWRADNGTECEVSDGTTQAVTLPGGRREEVPARPGAVPMALYPFFPIAAPIWGRSGDDWRMLEGPAKGNGTITVDLESTQEPGYRGKLVVDAAQGHLVELRLGAYSIIVTHFELTPPDPARLQP